MKAKTIDLLLTVSGIALSILVGVGATGYYYEYIRVPEVQTQADTRMQALNQAVNELALENIQLNGNSYSYTVSLSGKYADVATSVREQYVIDDDESYTEYKKSITPVYGKSYDHNKLNGYAYVRGDVSDKDIAYFVNFINLLPDKVIERFKAEDWKIILQADEITGTLLKPNETAGVCCYDEKCIYIHATETAIPSVLHQFGHFVYKYMTKDALDAAGLNSTSAGELNTYAPSRRNTLYATWNYTEMVAEIFADTILYPRETLSQIPRTTKIYWQIAGMEYIDRALDR